MAYIDELLGRDERVLLVGRQHPFVLIGNLLAELVLIAVLIAGAVLLQRASGAGAVVTSGFTIGAIVFFAAVVISVMLLVSALLDYLRWNNRQFVITDQRVMQIEGIFNMQVLDSSLEKINDLELRQSLLGRLFNYGDLEVLTGTEAGINLMQRISNPLAFKRTLLEAKNNLSRAFGYFDPAAVAAYTQPQPALSGDEIQQRLVTLTNLRDQGLISSEEFEAKKRDLLSRI